MKINNMKKLLKKSLWIMSGMAFLGLAWITGTGTILEYIHFADPLNEMGFFACCCAMAAGLLYIGFSKDDSIACSKELDNEWHRESM